MTESNFEYDLDIIDNTVLVEYEGLNNGRGIFSYNFDQPLDSVTVAREEDPWEYVLSELHNEQAYDSEVEGQKLGDLAEEYFGGEVELDVVDQDFVKVGIPAESEYDLNPEEAADWIITHLDAIQERYAEINHIDTSDPKSNLGRWIAEETGQIQTNR